MTNIEEKTMSAETRNIALSDFIDIDRRDVLKGAAALGAGSLLAPLTTTEEAKAFAY